MRPESFRQKDTSRGGNIALIVITDRHEALLNKIEGAIDAEVVDEWSYAGNHDFVFRGELADGVRFRPTIGDAIVFGIVPADGVPLTSFSPARAHASFAELLLGQADDSFDSAEVTARFCEYDRPD